VKDITGIRPKVNKNIRGNKYNEALAKLEVDDHVLVAFGYTYYRKGVTHDVISSYILDSYGNEYMAKHFPDFSKSVLKRATPLAEESRGAAKELKKMAGKKNLHNQYNR
jgi:hypothetical protein